jgi:hypothetical protein
MEALIALIAIAAFWVGLMVGVDVGESWARSDGERQDEDND